MSKHAPVAANVSIQLYALLFLVLGSGVGAALGFQVGAVTDGAYSDLTMVPEATAEKAFNWLLFELGLLAGLISCAVLLAASFRTPPGAPPTP